MQGRIKYSSAEERREGDAGVSRQHAERFALAMLVPLFQRILQAILPIRMGPVDEGPGLVASPVETPEQDARRIDEAVWRRDGLRPPTDFLDSLEGKLPFRVRTDLKIDGEHVVRFDIHQRIQHVLMFTSFLTLAFTGLPQKLHDLSISQWIIAALGGLEQTQTIHHIAAFVMLADCAYHLIYVALGVLVFKNMAPLQMIPSLKDFKDAVQQFSYFLGLTDEQPKFDRYSYLEKFDYWAVFWGIFIIGGSGLVLMFPVWATKVLPGGIIPVALVAHSDEAVLAVGWIFVVHFFYAHFVPRIFPFNPSIFTGRVPKHRYVEEHPLDWERAIARMRREADSATPARSAAMRNDRRLDKAQLVRIVGNPSGGAVVELQSVEDDRILSS